ncbi:hypothetical protein B0H17DRAFT_1149200 [Mycena rosella]|uniref:Uncharacterized protein n=1 Tax=Mycena rosella TaxID=1033263 RepID=A0AAD7FS20_MYCRO|nr:hypothetical protein B0H17DRAFT_1149200 [Mycena rosella]
MSILKTWPLGPAPARRHTALLKSVDPKVSALFCPGGRAPNLENCAIREICEFLDTHAQTPACSPPTRRSAASNDGIVAVGCTCNRVQNTHERAAQFVLGHPNSPSAVWPLGDVSKRSQETPAMVPNRFYLQRGSTPQPGLNVPATVEHGVFSPAHGCKRRGSD